MKIEIEISEDVLETMLCSAFDSGIAYWATVRDYNNASAEDVPLYKVALQIPTTQCSSGGFVQLGTHDSDTPAPKRLNRAAVFRGLQLMATEHPKHFASVLQQRTDAITGDVLVQLAVFGRLVFA